MRTLEEAILLAVLNEDETVANELLARMLFGELCGFSSALIRAKRLVDDRLARIPRRPLDE